MKHGKNPRLKTPRQKRPTGKLHPIKQIGRDGVKAILRPWSTKGGLPRVRSRKTPRLTKGQFITRAIGRPPWHTGTRNPCDHHSAHRIIESRVTQFGQRRRRHQCAKCGNRWTTWRSVTSPVVNRSTA